MNVLQLQKAAELLNDEWPREVVSLLELGEGCQLNVGPFPGTKRRWVIDSAGIARDITSGDITPGKEEEQDG